MSMSSFKRVRYQKSPLVEVVFQLRFPTILIINSNQPVDFQERIRERYPFFEEQTEEQGDILVNPQLKAAQMRKIGENKNYNFISADNQYKVNLTPSFISISTKNYTQWEKFREHIKFVIPVFEEIYKPSFYTRIGLRYIDVIVKSKLGLECEWTELIKPHILGMINKEYEKGVKSYVSISEYQTKIEGVLSTSRFELVHVNNEQDLSLLIDCDYYSMGVVDTENMNDLSEKLHDASSNFIQSAITEKLYTAMEPREL